MATPSRVDQLLQLTDVIWTAASFAVFFLQEDASTAASSAGRQPALFPQFRTDSGRSVQQAAESAAVSPSPAGRPYAFLLAG